MGNCSLRFSSQFPCVSIASSAVGSLAPEAPRLTFSPKRTGPDLKRHDYQASNLIGLACLGDLSQGSAGVSSSGGEDACSPQVRHTTVASRKVPLGVVQHSGGSGQQMASKQLFKMCCFSL